MGRAGGVSLATPKIRILIVDDHPVVREGLAAMIDGRADMEAVGEAETGEEAIAAYARLGPDIVLLDLKLPDRDGISVIDAIRQYDSNARIIVLTTYVGDVQAQRALKAGAAGYLLKASLSRDLRDSILAVHQGSTKIQGEVAAALAQHTADEPLTARELDVLRQISSGCSNKLVADRLGIREDTVKAHVTNILAKLKASDRTHAVIIALQRGYFEL
jgi:two-component system NarL family response regulator